MITQVNKICPETKPLVSIQFWVADSEAGIRFSPSRQNFAVLPILWLPGTKISFSRFVKKTIRDIENLITFRRFRIKFCAFTKKK